MPLYLVIGCWSKEGHRQRRVHPPNLVASRLKSEFTVTCAAAHNLLEAMVQLIGDYILYWVGAPIFSDTHEKNYAV